MNFPQLVISLVQEQLEARPELLGLRLSPVLISAEEALELARLAPKALGERVYVSVSAPGAPLESRPRVIVAPDERAAEKATEWRNTLRADHGEHLLYVSVEEHGRAGGLEDCLLPLDEEMLRERFRALCDDTESDIPKGLGAALKEARLIDSVSAHQLCAFSEEYARRAADGVEPWEAVGQSLGALHLASDSRMRAADVVDRLRANAKLVAQMSAPERQASRSRPSDEEALLTALRETVEDGGDLAAVDLKQVGTSRLCQLAKVKPPRSSASRRREAAKPNKTSAAKKKKTKTTKAPRSSTTIAGAKPGQESVTVEETFVEGVLTTEQSARPTEASARSRRIVGDPRVLDDRTHRLELGRRGLPSGLRELLRAAVAESSGEPLEVTFRGDPRGALDKLPRGHQITAREPTIASSKQELEALRAARAALLEVLGELRREAAAGLALLVDAPLLVLAEQDVRDSAAALLERWDALLREANGSCDEGGLRALLNLDTVTLRTVAGRQLLVISPLHPLWLAQASARFQALLREQQTDDVARRLVARSIATAPVAPQRWPTIDGGWFERAPLSRRLPVYDDRAEGVPGERVREAAQLLTQRLLELEPHANLGLRVFVSGRGAVDAIEGIAAHLRALPHHVPCEVHTAAALGRLSAATALRVREGRLRVLPMPRAGEATRRPHINIVADPAATAPQHEEPSPPESAGRCGGVGLLPTRFVLQGGELRVETPVEGCDVLEPLEAALARAEDRQPRKAFVHRAAAASLQAALQNDGKRGVTWDAVIAQRIAGYLPPSTFGLVRQRIDASCEVAVASGSIDPAARWLEAGLQRLGVQNLKPRTLRALAESLAGAGIGGLVSLTGPGDHLLAAATTPWSPPSTATPIGPSSAASRATTAPAPTRWRSPDHRRASR